VAGGEPTVQFAFCRALLQAARAEGIHTCLDTCGAVAWERLEALLPWVSLFLYDYKATGDDSHRALTGVDTSLVHGNLRRLLERGAAVRLRCPLVPGVNDNTAHLAAIRALRAEFPGLEADVMAYHDIGNPKYADLGRPVPDLRTRLPRPEEIARWREALKG
jgi:pyruvate formate lyase activating enzyme